MFYEYFLTTYAIVMGIAAALGTCAAIIGVGLLIVAAFYWAFVNATERVVARKKSPEEIKWPDEYQFPELRDRK